MKERRSAMAECVPRQFICVFCGNEFKDDVTADSGTSSVQDTDFRVHFLAVQTTPHLVHTCPSCGFTDEFHEEKLQSEDTEGIEEALRSFCLDKDPQRFSLTQQYELLARIFILRNRPSIEIAQAYLNAAWMAEDEKNTALGNNYRENATIFFTNAIETQQVEQAKVPLITYLIGELNRRSGNFKEALEWFSKVRSEDPRLMRLRDNQKFFATVQKSVNTRMPDI